MEQQPPTGSIRWREWDEEAFCLAEREGKPILLALTATWCHWCHIMDQTSYSHPEVIGLVNLRFIPVRVDVDRRPDISYRYNQGGFPSVVFLDANGEVITGRVYTPPEQLVPLLEKVSAQYLGVGAIHESPLQVDRQTDTTSALLARPLPKDDGDSPTGLVLQRLQEIYDGNFGGFGLEPKQPPWEALKLLLALYSRSGDKSLLKMLAATLEGMRSGLYDQKDQGFFRYSVSRDWKVPHYEKMLSTNANLSSTYLEAYQVTGRKPYEDTAIGTLAYLLGPLYDRARGLFYASQDAAEEYYRLPWRDREKVQKPSIDRTFYTGLNAVAASSLSKAFGVLGQPSYLKTAAKVLDLLWDEGWDSDRGLCHIIGEPAMQPLFLADHTCAAQAFLDLYQAAGDQAWAHGRAFLRRAIELVQRIRELFSAPDGGFYDISEDVKSPQLSSTKGELGEILLQREKPVLENSLLAEVLVRLYYLTGEGQYRDLAKKTLETFNGVAPGTSYVGPKASRRMEEDEERLFLPAGSAWGRAWDMLASEPVHMVLVGSLSHPRTRGLLKAALRTYAPHKILQLLDPEEDEDRISSLGFVPSGDSALYVCMSGMCLAPIKMPEEVRGLKATRPWAAVGFTKR